MDSSPHGQFSPWTVRPMDSLPHGQFAPWTVRPMDSSPHGQFTPWTVHLMDSSPHGQFTPWTVRPMDSLPHGQFAPLDSSPHGQLAPWTNCPMYVHCPKKFRQFSLVLIYQYLKTVLGYEDLNTHFELLFLCMKLAYFPFDVEACTVRNCI